MVHYVFDLPRRPKAGFISAAAYPPVPWPDPVVAVGRLGIDGDAGKDVARLRLHVRVDLRGIDLAVVGRRCIRLDFIDVIGS